MTILPFLAALFMSIPPDIEIPPDLEECVLAADKCVQGIGYPSCDDAPAYQVCLADYETCSYQYPEAHEPACRTAFAWCQLEHCDMGPVQAAECVVIRDLCGD